MYHLPLLIIHSSLLLLLFFSASPALSIHGVPEPMSALGENTVKPYASDLFIPDSH